MRYKKEIRHQVNIMYYPLFMQLSTAHCLLVGAGAVGLRKARTLLAAHPASLLVLDITEPGAEWDAVRAHPALCLETRPFTPHDVHGRNLVFACTGCRAVNAEVAQACRERGILCNCADAPEEGSFIVPATARAGFDDSIHNEGAYNAPTPKNRQNGELMAALSTGGDSPAWAKVLREELEVWLTPRVPMTVLLARLRPLVLALGADTGQNTALFRTLVRSPLRHALAQRNAQACRQYLREALPDALHPHIPELLYDLI